MQYSIYEGNLNNLEKKLQRIHNKCRARGLDFTYQILGDNYKTVTDEDGKENILRFVTIEVEGKLDIQGYTVVAKIDHNKSGNIITVCDDTFEVPPFYYKAEATCDHCHTPRQRKVTYLLQNNETQELMEVGKSCLNDFCGATDAELIAAYYSLFQGLIKGHQPMGLTGQIYIHVPTFLLCVIETIKHFGYIKRYDPLREENETTASKAYQYYMATYQSDSIYNAKTIKEEMRRHSIKIERPENKEKEKQIGQWLLSMPDDIQKVYLHNIVVLYKEEFTTTDKIYLLASIPAAYDKTMKFRKDLTRDLQESQWQGQVNEKITFTLDTLTCLAKWQGMYGPTYMYRLTDTKGNVYIWRTSGKYLTYKDFQTKELTATVKKHETYRGIQQTVILRVHEKNMNNP